MTDANLLARWSLWYPDTPPVAFLLREAYPHRWLRIYSLPEGRRYPTSGFDYAELLRRHNAVADDLLGAEQRCAILLVHSCTGNNVHAIGKEAGLTRSGLPRLAQLPLELSDERTGVFATPMCIFGLQVTWVHGAFNRFITEVAEDRSHGLVVNLGSGQVYAPYDGGADLFYLTEVERDRARDRFRDWVSPREDGL